MNNKVNAISFISNTYVGVPFRSIKKKVPFPTPLPAFLALIYIIRVIMDRMPLIVVYLLSLKAIKLLTNYMLILTNRSFKFRS